MQSRSEVDTTPVTVCVSVKVKPEHEKDLQTWLEGVGQAASQFDGHQGLTILRPTSPTSLDYVYIFRFDTYAHLKQWEDSQIRRVWVEQLGDLTSGEARKQIVTGLEYWFTLPGTAATIPPPRYKMVIVTVMIIYPLSSLLPPLLIPRLSFLPLLVRGLPVSILLVLLMTYIIMPWMTRLFARWLFPSTHKTLERKSGETA
jgi:uncharacterized protein